MKERPILMAAGPVRNILAGRQTQDRRPVEPQPYIDPKWGLVWEPKGKNHPTGSPWYCERNCNWNPINNAFKDFWSDRGGSPYGQPGDRLWVRETFGFVGYETDAHDNWVDWVPDRPATPIHEVKFGGTGYYSGHVIYRADGEFEWNAGDDPCIETCTCWHPSIHMPRWASRITLEITGVRVERLQDISAKDVWAEGIDWHEFSGDSRALDQWGWCEFGTLWESCYGPGSWDANPWVWVTEFKRL